MAYHQFQAGRAGHVQMGVTVGFSLQQFSEVLKIRDAAGQPYILIGGQPSAEIDNRPPCPENRQQASDQLDGHSSIDRHRQMPAGKNQTVSGAAVGTGLQEIQRRWYLR
jgi:hypothetical protein